MDARFEHFVPTAIEDRDHTRLWMLKRCKACASNSLRRLRLIVGT
jgi:hypothetical protein